MAPPVRQQGRLIAQRFLLIDELGRGGMASVWRAEHLALKSPVAIKLLDPSIGEDPEMAERFLREAQAAAALRSRHVVQIFDYGVDDGVPFIAMELLDGESLRDRLERLDRLVPSDLARIFQQVARAVGKAHDAGIVHRDLKPDNIFLVQDEDETAKVLDFGIAKIGKALGGVGDSVSTLTGRVLGTPFYMSPEQARGDKAIDHRTDLWALGVIAFECLTGTRPFEGHGLGDIIVQICTAPVPIPSAFAPVPDGFDEWFTRAVARSPDDRFQSAKEMSEALSRLLGADTSPAISPPVISAELVVVPTLVSEIPKARPVETLTERTATLDVAIDPAVSPKRPRAWTIGGAVLTIAVVSWLGFRARHDDSTNTRTTPREEPRHAASGAAEPKTGSPATVADEAQAPASEATLPGVAPTVPAASAPVPEPLEPPKSRTHPGRRGQATSPAASATAVPQVQHERRTGWDVFSDRE